MIRPRVTALCLCLPLAFGDGRFAERSRTAWTLSAARRRWISPATRSGCGTAATVLAWVFLRSLHYQHGGSARIVITGPEELLRHVRVGDGRIEADHDGPWRSFDGEGKLDITVSGVPLDHVSLGGSGKLLLGHLEQDTAQHRHRRQRHARAPKARLIICG